MKYLLIAMLVVSCATQEKKPEEQKKPETTPVATNPAPTPTPERWQWQAPAPNAKFQIMDEDEGNYAKQLRPDTKVVNVELFGTDAKQNAELNAKGVYVVCYYSLSYEPWRPDAKDFPKAAIGKKMKGWNEYWPNLYNDDFHKFMDKRDNLAKSIGCNAVENDNMDNGEDAFNLTEEQLILSNKRRAYHAHSVGLGHIAKNTPDLSKFLVADSDGVFIEEAREYDEVNSYLPWKGKFAGFVEYSKSNAKCLDWAQVQYHSGSEYFKGDYGTCR